MSGNAGKSHVDGNALILTPPQTPCGYPLPDFRFFIRRAMPLPTALDLLTYQPPARQINNSMKTTLSPPFRIFFATLRESAAPVLSPDKVIFF